MFFTRFKIVILDVLHQAQDDHHLVFVDQYHYQLGWLWSALEVTLERFKDCIFIKFVIPITVEQISLSSPVVVWEPILGPAVESVWKESCNVSHDRVLFLLLPPPCSLGSWRVFLAIFWSFCPWQGVTKTDWDHQKQKQQKHGLRHLYWRHHNWQQSPGKCNHGARILSRISHFADILD